jgi:hypothetical protein
MVESSVTADSKFAQPAPIFNIPHMNHSPSIKLAKDNYMAWQFHLLASVTAASMLPVVVDSPMVVATVVPFLVDVVPPLADGAVASTFMAPIPLDPSARFTTNLAIMPAPATNALTKLLRLISVSIAGFLLLSQSTY